MRCPYWVLRFAFLKFSSLLTPIRAIKIYISAKSFKYRNLDKKEFTLLRSIT